MKKFLILLIVIIGIGVPFYNSFAIVNKTNSTKSSIKKHRKTIKKKKVRKIVKRKVKAPKLKLSFSFTGRGYGHGVGMSQFGAEGMAEKGYSYQNILKYYYTGVAITESNTTGAAINVALKLNAPYVNLSSKKAYSINDPVTHNKLFDLAANSSTKIQYQNGSYLISNSNLTDAQTTTACGIEISTTEGGVLAVKGNSYEGTINISRNNTINNNIDVINTLPLENYLRGVIPSEIYSDWKSEAIKAQILAARTYALKQVELNKNNKFEVYDSVLSQVYNGVGVSVPRIDGLITSTLGEVITYKGKLIDALYSASAGGYTVDASFIWGTDIPYLKGKPDPFDKSVYSKNWWTYTINRKALEKLFPSVGTIYKISVWSKKFSRPTVIKITGSKNAISVRTPTFRDKLNYTNIASAIFSI